MSKKIEIIGQAIVITDTDTLEVLYDAPKGEVYYDSKMLSEQSVIKINNLDVADNIKTSAASIQLWEAVDSGDVPFTKESFVTFARTNLGFKTSSGGSGEGAVDSVFGRSGIVSAQAGDYSAEQITETASRVFVTTSEKAAIATNSSKISADVNATNQGNTFNGSNQLVQLDGTGKLPAIDGSQLTNLPVAGASVDDTAFAVSWNGVTTIAPSKNAVYDMFTNLAFQVDSASPIKPVWWGGTQAEYDIAFPSGHPSNYFVVVTDGAITPITADDITLDDSAFSGNLEVGDDTVQKLANKVDGLVLGGGGLAAADIDTLAKLNAIITDADLIPSTDSRLTDARTPTSHTHVKSEVGLSNVDNTSDLNKPISTATQTALDLKAPLASPNFTTSISLGGVEVPTISSASSLTNKTYNGVNLTTGGSATNFLNAQGNYVAAGGSMNLYVAEITITNPTITTGFYDQELIAAKGTDKVVVVHNLSASTNSISAGTGNTNIQVKYAGDGVLFHDGLLWGVSGGYNVYTATDTANRRGIDARNMAINVRLTNTVDQSYTGVVKVVATYSIITIP